MSYRDARRGQDRRSRGLTLRVPTPDTPIKDERTRFDLFSAHVRPQANPTRRVATPHTPIKGECTWFDLFPRAFALDPCECP
ncbi:hypothetical protein Pa4123_75090 [Phytohabitans aurantiacus]|uniref:Uncharacterized protein n=1 Tax=Phytohabitans aurantiacus TaxID=3016789 RepID=A0ABQ5R6N4_9ACTN|nr:hypothetical protein Pa4123_75090 [Phytohabitans aurantiacus]